jgi:hypothetical protein
MREIILGGVWVLPTFRENSANRRLARKRGLGKLPQPNKRTKFASRCAGCEAPCITGIGSISANCLEQTKNQGGNVKCKH